MNDTSTNCYSNFATARLILLPLTELSSIMWDAGIEDAHVIEFLIAKKAIKDRSVRLKEVNPKVIARLVEKFDDVLAFKPAL